MEYEDMCLEMPVMWMKRNGAALVYKFVEKGWRVTNMFDIFLAPPSAIVVMR
jgi:hypothetical protein